MLKNTQADLKQKGFVFVCFLWKSVFLEVKRIKQKSKDYYMYALCSRNLVIIQMDTLYVSDAL